MDIAEFLSARFDEEFAAAVAAQEADPAPWRANTTKRGSTEQRLGHGSGLVIAGDDTALWDCEGSNTLCMTAPTAWHVAHWDPARVLADVRAKRAIVEDYVTTCRIRDEAARRIKEAQAGGQINSEALDEWGRANREAAVLEGVARQLATAYADHEDFQAASEAER